MYNGLNCDRKSQISEILTEPLNPRDQDNKKTKITRRSRSQEDQDYKKIN